MFTGIVESRGTVRDATGASLAIRCEEVVAGLAVGDSVNVNGCCVTVAQLVADGFVADLMPETRNRTTLGRLADDEPVNLERAVPATGRFGGHLVQGHVDAVGRIRDVDAGEDGTTLWVAAPEALAGYLVEKGSVAVDGCSLTIIAVDDGVFSVGLVPHTLAVTVLGRRVAGDEVNLEVDVVAKYVERLLRSGLETPYRS